VWCFLTARFIGVGASSGQLDTSFNGTGYSINTGASPTGNSAGGTVQVQSGNQVVTIGWTVGGNYRYFGLLGFTYNGGFGF
jgi:hypothetical protein